jgi:hypothetical protein
VPSTATLGTDNSVTGNVGVPAADGNVANGWEVDVTSNGNQPAQAWVICVPGTPSNSSNGS